MGEGIVVNRAPVAVHESRDEQQQRALRLVEVGDHHPHDVVFVSGSYDDLRTGVQCFHVVTVQIIEYML